jgi:dihydrofolate synthase/folylpolyglutamate synthase
MEIKMSYPETLTYLYSRLPMYHRVGAVAFKKDLTNTLALCAHLGDPHRQFPSVHVAGTNGKGSVSHMLAAIAQAAGLKVGLYTSPHYKDFRERIKVNGQLMSRKAVVDFVANNRDALEQIQPSFFEATVAMAFDHFAREKVDLAIVEVGLGGRLDSTNVINPLLSVITNISYDHMDMLGDTLPLIAAEKAGIIKSGVPVVIGESHAETMPVFIDRAQAMDSPIVFADQRVRVNEQPSDAPAHSRFDVWVDGVLTYPNLLVEAAGPYLPANLTTLLEAWHHLPQVSETAMRHGLAHLQSLTRYMGRWQFIGDHPVILCDSAHNEAGLRSAFSRICTMPCRNLHVVTGFVQDKDLGKALPLFPTQARYYFAKADIPRGLDAAALRLQASSYGLHGRAYRSVKYALRAARRAASPDDLIVVIGSIFVVAEVV